MKLVFRVWLVLMAALLVPFFPAVHAEGGNGATAADYADPENWAYYCVGEGKDADVFLVCPTVDVKDEYNMSLDDEKTKAAFLGALNMERGIYEDCGRLFAPYYRQAAMKAYSLDVDGAEPFLALAYADVSAAFAHYLTHENQGRPFILAGFSQGADMCLRLMKEYFGDEALREQLVAVYVIGWPCTKEMVSAWPQIVPASGPDDVGVVISFDCEAPAVRDENLGACFTDCSGKIRREEAGLCDCYIDEARGAVKVTDVAAGDYPAVVPGLPEGAYHI